MPLRMYDFECPRGHSFEELVSDPKESPECPKCHLGGLRVISPIRSKLDPLTFPGASFKWIKEHEKAGNPKTA